MFCVLFFVISGSHLGCLFGTKMGPICRLGRPGGSLGVQSGTKRGSGLDIDRFGVPFWLISASLGGHFGPFWTDFGCHFRRLGCHFGSFGIRAVSSWLICVIFFALSSRDPSPSSIHRSIKMLKQLAITAYTDRRSGIPGRNAGQERMRQNVSNRRLMIHCPVA